MRQVTVESPAFLNPVGDCFRESTSTFIGPEPSWHPRPMPPAPIGGAGVSALGAGGMAGNGTYGGSGGGAAGMGGGMGGGIGGSMGGIGTGGAIGVGGSISGASGMGGVLRQFNS
jgi:hypothetical protein